MKTHIRRRIVAASAALLIGGGLVGCSNAAQPGVTTLDFFQFKAEAADDFEAIIEQFEQENSDIEVVQNVTPESETALRTLLVKEAAPDVITFNGNYSFAELARAGAFYDFSEQPVLASIDPTIQGILDGLGTRDGETNGLSHIANANGILYNVDLFDKHGLAVPETWDELIAVCERLEELGITPIVGTLGDGWTTLASWNAIGAYDAQGGFFDELRAAGSEVGPDAASSFETDFTRTMDRQAELYSHTQDGSRGATYDVGNAMFANGEAAMMLQGVWALAPVSEIAPDLNTALFPYPVPDDPDDRVLVSGIDLAVTMPREPEHEEASLRFIEFLFRPDIVETIAASQTMIPAVEGAELSDHPAMAAARPWVESGRVTGFIDHQMPPSIPLAGLVQDALLNGASDRVLQSLDHEWNKVARRTIPMTED